jgi:integrase
MRDLYNYPRRLERAKQRVSELRNSDLALSFLDHLEALGLSVGRVAKYANHLCTLLKVIDFDPTSASKKDVERVVAWINSQQYKASTKRDLKLIIRKLIQYAKLGSCDKKTPLPPEVAWISLTLKEKDLRVKPESILKPEDLKAIIESAENERDKALLYVLFEGAFRPGELLTMKVGSVEFRDNYCLVSVNGKTGVKRIPLVLSYKPLLEWLERHPERDNPNAPLWTSLSHHAKGKALSYGYFRMLVKRIAKKAGIRKDVWPYLFRHSSLTSLAKVFTESKLELYAGWVQGSKMARRYVHFSARDLEEAVLTLHGLKQPDKADSMLRLVECPRCGSRNAPGNVRCGFCGLVLDRETAIKMAEEKERRDREIIERLERLEQVVSSLLSPQLEDGGFQPNASTQRSPSKSPPKPSSQQPRTHHSYKTPTTKDLTAFKGQM